MTARPRRCGQVTGNVRLSHYIEWIENVMSGHSQADADNSFKLDLLRGSVYMP